MAEINPVIAVIPLEETRVPNTTDSSQKSLGNMLTWASEQGYAHIAVLDNISGQDISKLTNSFDGVGLYPTPYPIEAQENRNRIIDVISPTSDDALIHFLDPQTTPFSLSANRAADVLRASQLDMPRAVGGLVLDSFEKPLLDNYGPADCAVRYTIREQTLAEIATFISSYRPVDTYISAPRNPQEEMVVPRPVEWVNPANVAIPFDAFRAVKGFPVESDEPHKDLAILLRREGIPHYFDPAIAVQFRDASTKEIYTLNGQQRPMRPLLKQGSWPFKRRKRTET